MSSTKDLRKAFSIQELLDLYRSAVQHGAVVGIDRVNRISFERRLADNLELISRKVLDNSYRFSLYKEKLILKGRKSPPRLISIPTIRDRIVLKALARLLKKAYQSELRNVLIHSTINELKRCIGSENFTHFIRIDVANFYPSIRHQDLLRKIRRKARDPILHSLLKAAIRKQTVSGRNELIPPNECGVPQGLSISNILADIYLLNLDKKHSKEDRYKYFRYVDDILVLCNGHDVKEIRGGIEKELSNLGLSLNTDKSRDGLLNEGISYLGYTFNGRKFTVREETIDRLKESLLKSIVQFHYASRKNYQVLEWKLNLRITGCRFDRRKYGWMFFFSQINDLTLLYSLDSYVVRICERYKVDLNELRLKRFVRTYHEITKNLTNTGYIPDFDSALISEKRRILDKIFGTRRAGELPENVIESRFRRSIFRSVKDLEKDISRGS